MSKTQPLVDDAKKLVDAALAVIRDAVRERDRAFVHLEELGLLAMMQRADVS